MPSNQSASWGARCELAAADKYGLRRRPGAGYDLESKQNGTIYQVKGADVAREQPRCRFWLGDHLRLMRAHQAAYIVVRYSSTTGRVKDIEKVSVQELADLASWGPSGHAGGKGRQTKIPVGDLI